MPTPPAASVIVKPIAFRASWNRSTRLLTAVFLLSGATILGLSYSGPSPSLFFYSTCAVVLTAIALAFWFAPTGYHIDDLSVGVQRRAGRKAMPLRSLKAARLMEPGELAGSTWRFPAVGGLFGFYGVFETPALGRHRWYASRDQDQVLLQTSRGPVVLSPDDAENFVREVNQRLRACARI